MKQDPKQHFPPPQKNIYDGNDELDYDFEKLELGEKENEELTEGEKRKEKKYLDEIDKENGDY
jgi:hypothetical protein